MEIAVWSARGYPWYWQVSDTSIGNHNQYNFLGPYSQSICISINIDKEGGTMFDIDGIQEGRWYTVNIKQILEEVNNLHKLHHLKNVNVFWKDEFYFQVLVDGRQKIKVNNPEPLYFEDVRVLASDNYYLPAEGVLSNLHVTTWPDGLSLLPSFIILKLKSHLFIDQYSKLPDDIPKISQILIQDQGKPIEQDNIIGTFKTWGPTFEIKFNVKINSFSSGYLREIIRFTAEKGDCCLIGQRVPAVFLSKH